MTDAEMFKILGPLSFRAAEKFFKFTSWAIIISVVRYAKDATGSSVLAWLDAIATIAFTAALLMQAFFMFVREPKDWNIPPKWWTATRIAQIVIGILLLLVCTLPLFFLDTVIADLQNAKPHEIIANPQ